MEIKKDELTSITIYLTRSELHNLQNGLKQSINGKEEQLRNNQTHIIDHELSMDEYKLFKLLLANIS